MEVDGVQSTIANTWLFYESSRPPRSRSIAAIRDVDQLQIYMPSLERGPNGVMLGVAVAFIILSDFAF